MNHATIASEQLCSLAGQCFNTSGIADAELAADVSVRDELASDFSDITTRQRRTAIRQALITMLMVVVLSQNGYGQQSDAWSRFRGPNGSGLSDAKSIPTQWTDNDYNWTVTLPGIGHSSPVAWKNRIFVTSADPDTATQTVQCLDTSDGQVRWSREFESRTFGQHPGSSYADSTPAVDANGVVVSWTTPDEYIVLALDLDGNEQWRRDLGPFVGANGGGVSPIIVGDRVIVANDQDDVQLLRRITGKEDPNAPVGVSSILSLNRRDGTTQWKLERKTTLASYSTPCVRETEEGNRELILMSTARGISGVDLATGHVTWEITDVLLERCVGSPILADDLVIAGFGRGVNGESCVAARAGLNGTGDATTLAYEVKHAVPLVPTPVYRNGLLFLWADMGIVSCLNAATGEVVWRERVGGNFYGSPVCVGDHLYCIARNGDVVVLAASADYQQVARVALGEDSATTPAVSDGIMYLRTKSHLFSLGGPGR